MNDLNLNNQQLNLLLTKGECGFYDSTLWFGNSSSWGTVGEYDPDGTSLRGNKFFPKKIYHLTLI